MYRPTREEQETIINFDESTDRSTVYTHSAAMIRKLDQYCETHPNEYQLINQDEFSRTYEIPKKYISIRKPNKISEEQKAILSERLRKARA